MIAKTKRITTNLSNKVQLRKIKQSYKTSFNQGYESEKTETCNLPHKDPTKRVSFFFSLTLEKKKWFKKVAFDIQSQIISSLTIFVATSTIFIFKT